LTYSFTPAAALSRLNVSSALLGMNSNCIVGRAFHAVVLVEGRFAVVTDLFVKLVMLVLRDVFHGACSQRCYLSSRFPILVTTISLAVRFRLLSTLQAIRMGSEMWSGIVDDGLVGVQVVLCIFQVQGDAGARALHI
jgi:general stress protein CsbA